MRGAPPPLTQFSASIDAVYWDARSSCPIVLDYIVFFMLEDIDSCVAHKLPAIAALKVAAVRPGG